MKETIEWHNKKSLVPETNNTFTVIKVEELGGTDFSDDDSD